MKNFLNILSAASAILRRDKTKDFLINNDDVVFCVVRKGNMSHSTIFAGKVFRCNATFKDTNLRFASFAHIKAARGVTLKFKDVNLSCSYWTGAETDRVSFNNVNLFESNITVDQLARARYVGKDCTLPNGISYMDIMKRKRELRLANQPRRVETVLVL